MRTIAERLIMAMLAAAPGNSFRFLYFNNPGRKFRTLMRSVTIGLFLGFSAGAPGIFAWLDFKNVGAFLRAQRLAHIYSFRYITRTYLINGLSSPRKRGSTVLIPTGVYLAIWIPAGICSVMDSRFRENDIYEAVTTRFFIDEMPS